MVVQTNIAAMNANRMFGGNVKTQSKSTEKLSSGYRINRSADDAAGLTISEKMRSQIRGLTQASTNCQDGISLTQIADGALAEVNDMLHRAKELGVHAANGTLTEADRNAIQSEFEELTKEIDRVQQSTQFNTLEIFPKNGHAPSEISARDIAASEALNAGVVELSSGTTIKWEIKGVSETDKTSPSGQATSYYDSDLAKFAVNAAANAINDLQAAYPNLFGSSTQDVKLGLDLSNEDGKNGTLAYVSVDVGAGGKAMYYTLKIDTSDYPMDSFSSMSDAQKADLSATIAHEMTHALMFDTTTKLLFSAETPLWFIEGCAQTSSGDGNWVAVDNTSSDSAVKAFMKELEGNPYGAGYLAALDLGYEVAKDKLGLSAYTEENIKKGLDQLLTDISTGKSLTQAIADNTNYTGLADFVSAFKSDGAAGNGTLNNVKSILGLIGSGEGSLLKGMSKSQKDAFDSYKNPTAASRYYAVDPKYTSFGSAMASGVDLDGVKPGIYDGTNGGEDLIIQAGAQNSKALEIPIMRFNISAKALFGDPLPNMSTQNSAQESLEKIDIASDRVSAVRSYYGAVQNRMEHTIKNLDNIVENTQAAESKIRDTDMASEMVNYTKTNILLQAGQAMLAQANQSTQGVLSLLQ